MSPKKTTKKSAGKGTDKKQKRLSNEALMDKLVSEDASDAKIKKEFAKRYEGQTPQYIAKRIKIYRGISERRLGKVEQKAETKKSKKTSAKGKKSKAKEEVAEQAVNA